jgi:hypothetical protein
MNRPEPTTLQEWMSDTASGTFVEPRFAYDFSRVPPLTGMEQQSRPLLRTQPMVQRFPKDEAAGSGACPNCPEAASTEVSAPGEPEAETAPPTETAEPMTEIPGTETEATPALAEPGTESAASGETPASALIVDDSAADLAPGQMKKSEFLSRLKIEVCRTVEAAIAGTGRTTDECPYIDYWFDFYSRKESAHIERTIHRYAPEASSVTTASEYIPVFTQRARQAAETWARTGQITGVPEGLPMGLPGMGLLGGIGRLFSGIGSIFFKARKGGARKPDDPRAIQAELGEGRTLDSGVRSRMESAFGMDFAHVRTHTDSAAAGLSDRMNARAFTVGEHVAFGANEYKPGTLVGDALIAHELAHVVQQSGANSSVAPMKTGDASYNTLERDADSSALGVIASIWSGAKGALADIGQNTTPRLRSGLRLQRCGAARTARRTPESAAEGISGDTLCPQFISMTARIINEAYVSDIHRNRCRMRLGYCPTPLGTCGSSETSGAVFTATVETAEGCTGELSFLQNLLTSDRRRTLSDGTSECMNFTTPHLDGRNPWKGCTLPVTGAGRHTITRDDCPNIRLRETLSDRPEVSMTAASANDSFKMYLRWRPTGESNPVAIANVTWGWSGSTTRQEGTDCVSRWTDPQGSSTDGDGTASSEQPVMSPTVREDAEWRECGEE